MELNCHKFKIGVVGDVILDEYLFTEIKRISPEAPVPIAKAKKHEFRLGGAANVANNVAITGAQTFLWGAIAKDDSGKKLEKICEDTKITFFPITTKEKTTIKKRIIAQNQHVLRIDYETVEPISILSENSILSNIEKLNLDAIIVSDYGKGFLTPSLIQHITEVGVKIVAASPKPVNYNSYISYNLLSMNKAEFCYINNSYLENFDFDTTLEKISSMILKHLKLNNIDIYIVTLGKHGALMAQGEKVVYVPALEREVYDVTGAGDTAFAYYVMSILAGKSAIDSVIIGTIAGSIKVSKLGACAIHPNEIEQKYFNDIRSRCRIIYE